MSDIRESIVCSEYLAAYNEFHEALEILERSKKLLQQSVSKLDNVIERHKVVTELGYTHQAAEKLAATSYGINGINPFEQMTNPLVVSTLKEETTLGTKLKNLQYAIDQLEAQKQEDDEHSQPARSSENEPSESEENQSQE